jgi:DNA-directed RNA polymerase subunit RPC12/RpoP
MSGQKCVRCQKTAYPLESVQVNENRWHKICFKCVTCKVQLNVKTFFYREGGAYCEKCGSARFVRPLTGPFVLSSPPPSQPSHFLRSLVC